MPAAGLPVLSAIRRTVPGVEPSASFEFAASLWPHSGPDGWHFVTLPAGISADISELTARPRRGFGSVRVAVTVGATSWRTSIFPSRVTGTYVLPVKRSVRVAEGIDVGDEIRAVVTLAEGQPPVR
jgi:hypothetical protein